MHVTGKFIPSTTYHKNYFLSNILPLELETLTDTNIYLLLII